MVDGTQVGPLWDGASSVAKKAVTREQFVGQIGSQRTQLGPVVGRGQGAVTRVKYGPGAQVPEGLYINVSFPTRFAKAPQPGTRAGVVPPGRRQDLAIGRVQPAGVGQVIVAFERSNACN